VELITVESAVKFTFNFEAIGSEEDSTESSNNSQKSLVAFVKAELRAIAEAKACEGKKPTKGVVTAEAPAVDDSVFTPAFCQTLPVDVVRKSVSAQVRLHPRCNRRGYVLDLWDGRSIADAASLTEVLSSAVREDDKSCPRPPSLDLLLELQVGIFCTIPANLVRLSSYILSFHRSAKRVCPSTVW
jgi:hypothetical protein